MRNNWLLRMGIVLAGAASMAPGCNNDVLQDSTFRLWCGDNLCAWRLDTGSVKRVPTWHPDDYGVELADTPTQISQTTTEGSECMEFSAVADVDATASASIQVDFNFDGKPDYRWPLPETHWRPTKTLIFGPLGMSSQFRFMVRKDGTGHAALAEIRLQRADGCTDPRVALATSSLGIGDLCNEDAQCTSGICCGLPATEPDAGVVLGRCSACCTATPLRPCANGGCLEPKGFETAYVADRLPLLCAPGTRSGRTGDPCTGPDDCASQQCEGTVVYPNSATCEAGSACTVLAVHAGACR
jgi:hypothetical protein